MRAGEEALIDAGSSVDALMHLAGCGAADWIWRLAWPRPVTVLCGPGNNGGDGYVIAEELRRRGLPVSVIAPLSPATEAARNARDAYCGKVWSSSGVPDGAVLVDCLFGSGLSRPLDAGLSALLSELARIHPVRVAVDLPSGIESDSGRVLNEGLPDYQLTLALGAWKFAHWTMPAAVLMGRRHLVPIGVGGVRRAARLIDKPTLAAPAKDAHKYSRGLVVVVSGEMPGAALLASASAMRGGAGYVKLAASVAHPSTPPELVVRQDAISDPRLSALLIGPGLGRSDGSMRLLETALMRNVPSVLDADALILLQPHMIVGRSAPIVATPHEGELVSLATAFGVTASGKRAVAAELAARSGMVVVAKGSDTLVAAPDGRIALGRGGSSWLSVAGTGDVLAGLTASRLAAGSVPFSAAIEAVWLHSAVARKAIPPFTPFNLIDNISEAYSSCL